MKNLIQKIKNILILILSTIVAYVYYYVTNDFEITVAIFALGVSASLSLQQYKIENDKMFKELFIFYNDKYDKKFNDGLGKIVDKSNLDISYKLDASENLLVTDYLNMCAEQYLWYSKGRIDSQAWVSWKKGMEFYFRNPAINDHLMKEKKMSDSYYGMFGHFNF